MKTLTINNLIFLKASKNQNEVFDPAKHHGFYSVKRSNNKIVVIHLSNADNVIFAAFIRNSHDFKGLVNACKRGNGVFYQFAASSIIEERMGYPKGVFEQRAYVDSIFAQVE